jgi:GTPase involved in cell partitioning and DNA repair
MEKSNQTEMELDLQNEEQLDKFISNVDQEKVEEIRNDLESYKSSLKDKEYALSMDKSLLNRFENFMRQEVEWRAKESLGVVEILKRIEAVKKEGIKDGVVYFTNLEIEASHYFLMKWNGKGEDGINDFISLWKTFEESLALIQQDNLVLKDLEKQLAAAEQGIELE